MIMIKVPEHGCSVPKFTTAPCGSQASFELESLSYRCESCFAVLGSLGMPEYCKELYNEQKDSL